MENSSNCKAGCKQPSDKVSPKKIIPAMSTPLASIFGSGFLVVVPVLASAVGPYALLAMIMVSIVAFFVGTIIRHNILCAEPVLAAGSNPFTIFVEKLSDFALVIAYVISVCLYVHILSAFVLADFELDTEFNKSLLTSVIIGLITLIGLFGGLKPLEILEKWALYITIVLLGLMLVMFAVYDINQYITFNTFTLAAMPERSTWEILTIVAGTLIVVQGFETTRYLGEQYDAPTRIRASRWSQYFSLSVYIIFVALAQPIVPALNGVYGDNSLIALAATASLFLPIPLIIAASMSQFSAAVADTVAASANLKEATKQRVNARWGYLFVGVTAMLLAWTGSTLEIIATASRAFALYYLLQCVVAYSVCKSFKKRILFVVIGLILLFVLLFAVPAG